jgi:hypothetical protein
VPEVDAQDQVVKDHPDDPLGAGPASVGDVTYCLAAEK